VAQPVVITMDDAAIQTKRTVESFGQKRKLLLASPRGFCAGVVRAIDIVNIALERYGTPLFVRREIVHNKLVVNELRAKGTVFVEELDEVRPGCTVIFSAHGVSPDVRQEAKTRGLKVIDATCPLVTKVHHEAARFARTGHTIIMIGHADHDEVIGTLGEAPNAMIVVEHADDVDALEVPDPARVAYLTQTTLSVSDTRTVVERLRKKFPLIKEPASEDICYATQNRQNAVLQLAQRAEVLLVVGSPNSSNSRRLAEVAQSAGVPAHLIEDIQDIKLSWLSGIYVVGLTAGASAPEALVGKVMHFLAEAGYAEVETVGDVVEHVEFALPPELR